MRMHQKNTPRSLTGSEHRKQILFTANSTMPEGRIKNKGQKLAVGCRHTQFLSGIIVSVSHVERRIKVMTFMLHLRKMIALFASNSRQNNGKS